MSTALLLSGGIDSAAMAAWKKPKHCISIDYGQKPAEAEKRASTHLCSELRIDHVHIKADCSSLGSGDLAGLPAIDRAPATEWWPFRNQMLVTLAAQRAISIGVSTLWVATVRSDGFHKDGTSEFFARMSSLLSYQEGGISVTAPAIQLSSSELVKISGISPRLLAYCHSCHTSNLACGRCRGCCKHREVMDQLGLDVY